MCYVYIITNYKNTVLYTGITNNLTRRIFEHKNGLNGNSFTKKYGLYKLVWFQVFQSPKEAIVAEKKIKGWTRNRKLEIISETNPNFQEIKTF